MEVVVQYPTCPGFSSILLLYQTPAPGRTQTLTQEEQCTLGNAVWKCEEVVVDNTPPPLSWHKRQALPCRIYMDSRGSVRPFIIALLFLSLAGLLEQAEAPGTNTTSCPVPGPQDFNTFVF
ncbi:hypothetical protein JOB18_035628 [Solea senegalensis]|uniref:Uncharacterized protein n=1 Tax=Solea senegalensis TaxID=28829 RepID=A0AAV6R8Z3_SOLSE|nr:hypothetical protein JOB18_035628 [Solea senegalensis]